MQSLLEEGISDKQPTTTERNRKSDDRFYLMTSFIILTGYFGALNMFNNCQARTRIQNNFAAPWFHFSWYGKEIFAFTLTPWINTFYRGFYFIPVLLVYM